MLVSSVFLGEDWRNEIKASKIQEQRFKKLRSTIETLVDGRQFSSWSHFMAGVVVSEGFWPFVQNHDTIVQANILSNEAIDFEASHWTHRL